MFKPVDSNTNFPEMEKKWLKHWYKKGIVKKYLVKNKLAKKYFSFQDGPITANNPMGVHHAWGRTYKDLWPKFYNLLGYKQRFQNGFDCQGLWVEVEVEKELKLKNKKEIENLVPYDPTSPNSSVEASKKASIAKFVDLCRQRVFKYSAIQTEQSKRLGYFADWDHSYFTMSDENNYMIWHFLKICFENGWIYKGHESVPWCPRCETAISQHEMLTEDYKELVHESIYLELPLVGRKNEYLLIWTTTPWTLPANIAVAVDEKLDYSLVQGNTGYFFWVAKDLIGQVFGKDYKKIIKTVKGKELVGLHYQSPFDVLSVVKETAKKYSDKFHVVIATDSKILPVMTTEGTGLIHTAVSAGVEDFKLGKKLGLPMIPVIADNADYLPELEFLAGKNAKKHPEVILDYLKEQDAKGKNWVFKIEKYNHRYPACWRCKSELVWKVADEWYIAMDRPSQDQKSKIKNQNLTLRQRMMKVAKSIKWMPEFGLARELDWLKNMHDWLISKKNRYWGLALPIFECNKCNHFEVIGSKDELKNRSVKGWDKFVGHSPHKPYIDEIYIECSHCKELVKRVGDVGNPWLDAGIVPFSTISENNQGQPLYLSDNGQWKKWFPINFITESFPGQFKNWFYALIAMSTVLENNLPFEKVLGFATLTGEDGRPMHKSWGNMVEFNEGADKIGVDVMRWLFCRQNPRENLLFGYKKTNEVRRQFYLMLWNVYKYFVEYANLDKFKPSFDSFGKAQDKSAQDKQKFSNILDAWLLTRFSWLVSYVENSLKQYNSYNAALEIEKFVNDLSTWYIRRSRDRLWLNSVDKNDKANFYETLYYVLVNLSIVISPFLPFISEEIYTNLTQSESVHLEFWPKSSFEYNQKLDQDMSLIREIVEVGRRIRKELKIKVRQPLAKGTLFLPENKKFIYKNHLSEYERLITEELNIKKIDYKKTSKEEIEVSFDSQLTKELIYEGQLRELVRQIQEERKKLGLKPEEKVILTIPTEFKASTDYLKKRVVSESINLGSELKVTV